MLGELSFLNTCILSFYLISMLLVGVFFSFKQKNTEEYFLAGRKMPWITVAMSMYASLTSAVTFMALPGTAFRENISFIMVSFASIMLAPVLVHVFYPAYRKSKITTSYEYLEKRFGKRARVFTATLFLLSRLGAMGLIVYAPSLALSVVTGINLSICILAIGFLATIYTALGGLAADIWTDVIQFILMVGGIIWLCVEITNAVPGGVREILSIAHAQGHLKIADWNFSFTAMSGIVVGIGYFFQLMYDYGTDQTTVQRMLAVSSSKGVSKALYFNAIVDFIIIGALLFLGLGLFAFYGGTADVIESLGKNSDKLLPMFIIKYLPDGVSGLLIAALFAAAMSSMDSGISCSSTVILNDLISKKSFIKSDEKRELIFARSLTFILGVLATIAAFYVSSFKHLIDAYTNIVSIFNAPVLALFLLGILSKKVSFSNWLIGLVPGIVIPLLLLKYTKIHFTWQFILTLLITILVSLAVSVVKRQRKGVYEER